MNENRVTECSDYDPLGSVIYDVWQFRNGNVDAPSLAGIFRKYKCSKLCELGSGTGRLLRALWDMGFEVDGVDASADMYGRFLQNKALFECVRGNYHEADFRRWLPHGPYDAVFASRNTLAHCMSKEELTSVFRLAASRLTASGILVVDLDAFPSAWACAGMHNEEGGKNLIAEKHSITVRWLTCYDLNSSVSRFRMTGNLIQLEGGEQTKFVLTSETAIWDADSMTAIAREVGMTCAMTLSNYGRTLSPDKRCSFIYVFRRDEMRRP